MAQRKLTTEEQLKGVRAALRSPRTPPQLKEGLRKREQSLLGTLGRSVNGKRKPSKRSLLAQLFR
jgi:hypothetical protein